MKFHQIFNDFRLNIGRFGAIFGSFLLLFFDFKFSIDLGQFSEGKVLMKETRISRKPSFYLVKTMVLKVRQVGQIARSFE